jgi:hypothetical protein
MYPSFPSRRWSASSTLRRGVALGLTVLLLSACGSDDPPDPGPSALLGDAATAPPAASPAASPAAAAQPAADGAAPPPPATPRSPAAPVLRPAPDPAALTGSTPIALLGRALIDQTSAQRGWAALAGPAQCDVALHEIVHPTTGPRGEVTDASGAVLVPVGEGCAGPFPVLSYSRGTDLDRNRSMADPQDREVQAIVAFFAARGYVVVASDYLGYARSSFPYHPYLHADSEARTTVDALRAARVLLARYGIAESGRSFVAGYSQGGHAALATQRAIERDRPADVGPVAATGAMSGPYDLAGSFTDIASLLPLLTLGLTESGISRMVTMRLGDALGTEATELVRERDRLREVLQANSVIGWSPAAPMLLCGGARDPVVPYRNTTRAADDFRTRGAVVAVVDVDREPQWQALLPRADARPDQLGSYHHGAVPPLCFAAVRDRLFEPLR